jgi:hypothetical protein
MIEGAMRPILCALVCALVCAPAMAVGPVEGEVGAVWWSSDTETTSTAGDSSTGGGTPGVRGDLWILNRYGVRAGQYRSDDGGAVDHTSIDVLWRAFAPTANNFLAVGLGWQELQLGGAVAGGDTSGVRLSLEGHVGFTDLIQAYGQGAWLPSLADTAGPTGALEQLDGYEYEVGVAWGAAPFLSVRAGWRESTVGYTEASVLPTGSGFTPTSSKDSGGNKSISEGGQETDQSEQATLSSSTGEQSSRGWFLGLGFRF